MGGTDWHPVCLIRPGQKNVAMQVSTDNFMKFFEIVSRCLDAQAASEQAGVHTPTRKLRRTRSNPLQPKGPPEAREYYIKGKEWVLQTSKESVTPPSGSRTRGKGATNRRFVTKSPVTPKGVSSGLRPDAKKRASAGGNKRNTRTLSSAAAKARDSSDGEESSQDIFGGE